MRIGTLGIPCALVNAHPAQPRVCWIDGIGLPAGQAPWMRQVTENVIERAIFEQKNNDVLESRLRMHAYTLPLVTTWLPTMP